MKEYVGYLKLYFVRFKKNLFMVQNSKCTKSFNENEVSFVPQPPALRQLLRPMLYVSLGARMNACHTHRKDRSWVAGL